MAASECHQITKKKIPYNYFCFIVVLFYFDAAWGVEVHPRIELSETYSDNVNLSSAENEQNDYITQVNPGLNVSSEGKRASILFDYRMQNIDYKNNDEKNDTFHQAALNSKLELVASRFFLDLDGSFSQQNVSVSDAISFDNIGVDERNRSDVKTYRATPYYVQKIGKIAKIKFQYSEKGIDYEKNTSTVLDSSSKTTVVELASGRMFHKLSWRLSGSREKTIYEKNIFDVQDDGLDDEVLFEDSNAEVKYQLSPKTYLVGVKGYENNEYPNSENNTTKGGYWTAGVGWSPTSKTRLEFTRGERYIGKTHTISFSHEKKNMFWNLSYNEDVTTATKFEFELQDFDGINITVPVSTSEVFLSKALQFKVDLKSSQSTLAFNAFRFQREYLGTTETEANHGATLKLRWKMATNTYLKVSEKWLFNTFRGFEREDNVYDTSVGVEYKFGATSIAELAYSNLRRKSEKNAPDDTVNHDYKRNMIAINAKIYF